MRPSIWFIDIDSETSYVANDLPDVVMRVMCHYLGVEYPTYMYSYVQLRELFCIQFAVPFSHKRTPDTLLDYIKQTMPVRIVSDSNSLAVHPLKGYNRFVAFRVPHLDKTLYSNSYIEVYDTLKRFLFPNVNPSDTTYLLTLSGATHQQLLGKSKLDVVVALNECGYIQIQENTP